MMLVCIDDADHLSADEAKAYLPSSSIKKIKTKWVPVPLFYITTKFSTFNEVIHFYNIKTKLNNLSFRDKSTDKQFLLL